MIAPSAAYVSFARGAHKGALRNEYSDTRRACSAHDGRAIDGLPCVMRHAARYWNPIMATLPIGPHRVEEMTKYCLDLARKMLEANGAFYPFGAIIDSSGNRRPVMAESDEAKTTADAYGLIQTSMCRDFERGEIIAGAIAAIAGIPPEFKPDFPDGVRLTVESASISRLIFLPFKATPIEGGAPEKPGAHQVQFGELLGVNVKPTIFARPDTA